MHRAFTGLPVLFCLSAPLQAGEDIDHRPRRRKTSALFEDLAAVVALQGGGDGLGMGASGFDFGVTANSIKLEHRAGNLACACDAQGACCCPRSTVSAAEADRSYLTERRRTATSTSGREAHFGLVPEDATTPVSLRGTFNRLSVERLDFDSKGLELTVSKRFGAFTPYLGGGQVWIRSDPDPALFQREHFTAEKFYAGINLALGRTNLAFEGDETGDVRSYSAKLTCRF